MRLSQGSLNEMFILHELYYSSKMAKEIFDMFHHFFYFRPPNKKYFYTVLHRMDKRGDIEQKGTEAKQRRYSITEEGRTKYREQKDELLDRVKNMKLVADRFHYELTGSGEKVSPTLVAEEDRAYFSSLVSARDVIRYIILSAGFKEKQFTIVDVYNHLLDEYGWSTSASYIYEIAHRMEVGSEEHHEMSGLLSSYWEGKKRSNRLFKIEEQGHRFYPRLEQDTTSSIKDAKLTLKRWIELLGT